MFALGLIFLLISFNLEVMQKRGHNISDELIVNIGYIGICLLVVSLVTCAYRTMP
jgi:uncharacterized membrane protein YtjA (UPF0391 family)